MLTGSRFDGDEAKALGLVHYSCADPQSFSATLLQTLEQVKRCAPHANAMTKKLLLNEQRLSDDALLNRAAEYFSHAVRSDEGAEGTRAFVEKRRAAWVKE